MRSFNTIYSNFYQIDKYIKENKINEYSEILVQIFTGITDEKFAYTIIAEIKSILPQAHIIGVTTAGEILNNDYFLQTSVLSFSVFERTSIKSAIITNAKDDFALGQNLARQLLTDNTKAMVVFGTLSINGSDMLAGIESVGNHFMIAGGQAANNGYFHDTFVFCADELTYTGAVGVSLNSDVLKVFNGYSLCWQGIGKVMTITRAAKNRVYTIDGFKTRDIYERYLGTEVAKYLPGSATEFPLLFMRDGMQIARCPIAAYDDGSVDFIGNIEEGSKVLFSYGNIDLLIQRSKEIFEMWCSKNLESIFVFSCTARHAFMQERIKDELISLKNAPVCGFFTCGEYYQTEYKKDVLLNITTTLLGFSENEPIDNSCVKYDYNHKISPFFKDNFVTGKKTTVVDVLNNLVNAVVKDLEEINRDIEIKNHKLDTYARAVKENQEALIEREKAAGFEHLMAGITQNLNTPLTIISGGVALIQKLIKKMEEKSEIDQDFLENIRSWGDEIKKNSEYIAEIIGTINGYVVNPDNSQEKFSIEDLIKHLNIHMSNEFKKSKCKFEMNIKTDKKLEILGNTNNLVQVLNILITNSIDAYNGEGGLITLKMTQKNDLLEICITDYGVGINKEIAGKLLKEVITTKAPKGTGLGLYTAYSIVRGRLCGDIKFHSLAGSGTTFQITLPIIKSYLRAVK